MNPLFFGTGARRIFGIYEPPAGKAAGNRAAVICNAWGSEYVYAHRSMRQLAARLSMTGHHTLRFDFFGTGDSGGDMPDADLDGWDGDVESAVEEIKDIVGTARVTLIGLRLGATLAARFAAGRLSKAIDALVLWDPIVSGAEYLPELGVSSRPDTGSRDAALDEHGFTTEVRGFPLTTKMMRDLMAIDLRTSIAPPPARSLMVVTERLLSHDALSPVPAKAGSPSLEIEFMMAPCPWIEASAAAGTVPVRVIQRIVEWLG